MVWSVKSKGGSGGGEGWGMEFLLIFFPEDDSDSSSFHSKKKTHFALSSSSAVNSAARASSTFHSLLSKTQSTLSICALLVFTTFLFFTLSTFEPALPQHHHRPFQSSRRQLLLKSTTQNQIAVDSPLSLFKIPHIFNRNSQPLDVDGHDAAALQGMGTLYRRGTKAMSDLVVAHVPEDTVARELRTFLRILHYNGILAKSDLVLIFSNPNSSSTSAVEEECRLFGKLLQSYSALNETVRVGNHGLTRYLRVRKEEKQKETLWGKRTGVTRSTRWETEGLSYGSVVSFDASELDPENTLSGFLGHVPLSLRRWACYPMLLGRVKRNFKHIVLLDAKDMLVLLDPFTRVRNRSPESLLLLTDSGSEPGRRGKRTTGKTRDHNQPKPLNPGLVVGGGRGVRRLANAVLTEIVRVTIDRKGKTKNSGNESGIVNQLARNSYFLKRVKLIASTESIRDASEVNSAEPGFSLFGANYLVLQRGRRNSGVDLVIRREMCSLEIHSSIYSDCVAIQ